MLAVYAWESEWRSHGYVAQSPGKFQTRIAGSTYRELIRTAGEVFEPIAAGFELRASQLRRYCRLADEPIPKAVFVDAQSRLRDSAVSRVATNSALWPSDRAVLGRRKEKLLTGF